MGSVCAVEENTPAEDFPPHSRWINGVNAGQCTVPCTVHAADKGCLCPTPLIALD